LPNREQHFLKASDPVFYHEPRTTTEIQPLYPVLSHKQFQARPPGHSDYLHPPNRLEVYAKSQHTPAHQHINTPARLPAMVKQFGNIYLIAAIAVIGGGLFGFDISSMSAM
jgi:hypothetical protein